MCGIIAIFGKYNIKKAIDGLRTLEKRGPNCSTVIFKENEFQGFSRLSIMDLTMSGNQPMYDNNISLICNGEIYNYRELKDKYNISCVSNSDCEIILRLYKKIGIYKTIIELDGVFSFVIRDGDNIYVGRDRVGVRPLFFGIDNDCIALSSEAKAIMNNCTTNIIQFPAGSYMEFNVTNFNRRILCYNSDMYPENPIHLEASKLKNLLELSVLKRMMSDRPIGCLLSGGLDSSIVVSILSKLLPNNKLNTYSIGIKGSEDLRCARIVAEHCNTNHTEVLFTPEEGINIIPEVILALETYDITTIRASVGMYLISKYISENTDDKVIFSGEGSDEILCGYLYFHYAPTSDDLYKESQRLVRELSYYDVLRGDRCVSSNGLEIRVPFLDKDVVNYCLGLDGNVKKPLNKIEKYCLRKQFESDLPDEIVWRTKDGFSDSCSGKDKKWFEHIQDFVEKIITDEEFENSSVKFCSKEAYYYWKIYNKLFHNMKNPIPNGYWMPKWVDCNGDPSGRLLEVFEE